MLQASNGLFTSHHASQILLINLCDEGARYGPDFHLWAKYLHTPKHESNGYSTFSINLAVGQFKAVVTLDIDERWEMYTFYSLHHIHLVLEPHQCPPC